MDCPRCRARHDDEARFCEEYGTRLELMCASCGHPVTPEKKFCKGCGTPVGPTVPAGRFASPDAYTPQHLIEKIPTSNSSLEGQRKQVTVLFGNLKGSMELLADRNDKEARKLLDPVLEHMSTLSMYREMDIPYWLEQAERPTQE